MALTQVMRELFAEEAARDQRWIAEASAPGPAPVSTMHPPPLMTAPPPPDALSHEPPAPPIPRDRPSSSWVNGQPPEGMFAPPPSRPFWTPNPAPGAHDSAKPPPLGAPIESQSVAAGDFSLADGGEAPARGGHRAGRGRSRGRLRPSSPALTQRDTKNRRASPHRGRASHAFMRYESIHARRQVRNAGVGRAPRGARGRRLRQ